MCVIAAGFCCLYGAVRIHLVYVLVRYKCGQWSAGAGAAKISGVTENVWSRQAITMPRPYSSSVAVASASGAASYCARISGLERVQ
jgi:hypothetical protein